MLSLFRNYFLIETPIFVFKAVVITTPKLLKLSSTATSYVLMSLPCMKSLIFTLILFIGRLRNMYRKFSCTTVWIWLFCFKYVLYLILLVFWFQRSASISKIWYLFQIHFTKKKPLYTKLHSYLGNVSVATVTMAAKSPQPTILCVITLCVCLSSLYYQDVPFLDFVVLFVIVVVAVIVVGSQIWGMDWSVVIPLGTIICLLARGAGVGGV